VTGADWRVRAFDPTLQKGGVLGVMSRNPWRIKALVSRLHLLFRLDLGHTQVKSPHTAEGRGALGRVAPARDGRWTRSIVSWLGGATGFLSRAYDSIALRPLIAGVLITVVALLFAAAASAARGFPPPSVGDEFSYLLGADTFASGRLTNPTHPMWRYFETFHVIQQPTYNSKYPPANALFIAAGWALTGRPIVGVWVSFAFMCAAIYWMLRAWIGVKRGLGLSLAFTSWAAMSYWSYSYWGGTVAAGAGALMLGALYRIVEGRGGVGNAILLGLGLLLLANSRPFEGGLLALPAAVVFVRWLWRDRHATRRRKSTNVLLPLLLVGAVGLSCMGAYNKAITGSWRELPYSTYQKTRDATPSFIWQQPHVVAPVADKTIRSFNAWEDSMFRLARTPLSRVKYFWYLGSDFVGLVIPVALVFPLLLIPFATRSRWTRFALITIAWTVCGMGLATYFSPHYAAPLVGLVLVAYGGCLRWLSRLRVGNQPVGRVLAAAAVALWFFFGVGGTTVAFMSNKRASSIAMLASGWGAQRRLIADTLSRGGRRNLVVVRYGGTHSFHNEWVYNAANIDASPVVWARDMGDPGNQPLLDYFRGRADWVVQVNDDRGPFHVSPYVRLAP